MLREIGRRLDDWIAARNREARAEGLSTIRPCRIRVLGQTALLEAEAPLNLAATRDVDVVADYDHAVELQFQRLLAAEGRDLDPVGHEVWMPDETAYSVLYAGQWVEIVLADIDAVLLSKALKAPEKNRALVVEYLARGASERFFDLAKKHRLDLETFL